MKRDYYDKEDRPFNMAAFLMERLNLRLEESNKYSIEGSVLEWYRTLRAIKSSIIFKLDDNEKKELNEKFNRLRSKMLVYFQGGRKDFYFEVEQDLIAFEELVIFLMDKYELYYPKTSKKTWQEVAKEEDI